MKHKALKVGELSSRTGLSIRTLRYYDEIGLLSPSGRTESGHRLYTAKDVVRLQQIRSLKALGFALKEIRECLDHPEFSPRRVTGLHLARLRERISLQERLCERLEAIRLRLEEGSSAEEFVQTVMEVIAMSERSEKYYTPEQREKIKQRRREVGEERIRQVEAEWAELIEAVRIEMESGTDPSDERVRQLASHWIGLLEEFTGGDPGIQRSLNNMWQQEDEIHGFDTREMHRLGEYISRAMQRAQE